MTRPLHAPGARAAPPAAPLDSLRDGSCGIVRSVEIDGADGVRLKVLGICAGRRVMLVQRGDPLVLRVLGSRIGISARLAEHVLVEPCAEERTG